MSTAPVVTEPVAPSMPGWAAALPEPLKGNSSLTKFEKVGDLANDYLATTAKVADLEQRVGNSVPKLPDDATDEERGLYYDALGRPKDAKEYEFDGEDKNAPEWTSHWKQVSHKLGLTKAQGKGLSSEFNSQMTKMVEAHNAKIAGEVTAATENLKSEWGDKFDTNVELAKRMSQKHLGTDYDVAFDGGNELSRLNTIRLLFKVAALSGEDRSPQGGQPTNGGKPVRFIAYDKSPAPPKK